MMSPEIKQFTDESQEQDRKIVPLHHKSQNSPSEDRRMLQGIIDREALVSWLFLIGSLIFTLDAILENIKGVSFSSLLHISASILFTIGSVLFIPSDRQK
ncbi:MAG: hypothetical protein MUD14_07645 [Hydrococcus sp. Prado102]|jgi:hypothetical protein|nr:hypothetical protein [Hydrococcus sp. Prado102]